MNSNKRCPSCGAEVLTEAAFCPKCGKDLSHEISRQEQQQTQQDAPSEAASATQVPSLTGTERLSFTPLTGGSGGEEKSSRQLVLGTIVALAVLGLVAVALGAGFYFFILRDLGPDTRGSVGSQDSAPQEDSLKQRLQPRVGNFMMQQAMDRQDMYSTLGSTEALEMFYVTADGKQLQYFLMAFPSSTESNRVSMFLVQLTVLTQGWKMVGEDGVWDQEGSQIGSMVLLERGDEEMVEWTNNELRARVIGPKGSALDFYLGSKHQSGIA
jgi:predicted RNA-binding Zn-ribbon protein involved in translation (DUF1610 family)